MDRRKQSRKSLRYKIRRFFDQLEWEDIVKAAHFAFDNIMLALTAALIFLMLFFVPHFFH